MPRQPVPHAHFARDVKEQKESEQKEKRTSKHGTGVGEYKTANIGRRRHSGGNLDYERHDREGRDGIAEPNPVAPKKICRDERCGESPEAKEEVDEIQRGTSMGLADIADQRVRGSHHDAAAHSEQEHEKQNAAETPRARQGKERNGDEGESEDRPIFLPSLSSSGPTPSDAMTSPNACAKAIVPF